jgi:hypothetical protein
MDRFVARSNIEHFRAQLARETDETKRQLLIRLISDEEAKLKAMPLDGSRLAPEK